MPLARAAQGPFLMESSLQGPSIYQKKGSSYYPVTSSAGGPEEIGYMAHPHLGTDNLRTIVRNLRDQFINIGGSVLFETMLEDLKIEDGKVIEAITASGGIEADYFIIAPGHSAFETYRMLIRRGVAFRTKNFALGSRVEHPQEIINKAQWGSGESARSKGR